MIMFASIIPESYACSEPLFIQTHARLIPAFKPFFWAVLYSFLKAKQSVKTRKPYLVGVLAVIFSS